jgi:hypothetical protein
MPLSKWELKSYSYALGDAGDYDIAGILGYSNPETVRLLIKRYSKKNP